MASSTTPQYISGSKSRDSFWLTIVKGVFVAQEIKPQARVLADRGIDCLTVDYAVLKGTDDPSARLF